MGGGGMGVFIAALAVVVVPWLWAALVRLVWRPSAVARAFARQGVRGPPYRFFVGNSPEIKAMLAAAAASRAPLDRTSNDIVRRVAPHLRAWTPLYGKLVLSWHGSSPRLWVCDYAMAKRVLSDRAGLYVKPDAGPAVMAITGMGLFFAEGDDWARRRRVVHPALAMDRVKAMTGAMAVCAGEMIAAWAARAAASGEVKVELGAQFAELTADVISRTAFGSSYQRGKEVFMAQRELQLAAFATMSDVRVPWLDDYAPTKANVRRWQLTRTVRDTVMAIIDERLAAAKTGRGYGTDLLGLMLEANAAGDGGRTVMSMDEIIDECKTFFFAGNDTTAHLLTWAMFLLGTRLDWQRRLREEVLRECGGAEVPLHGDALNKLKLVTMVLNETLRLYGPGNTIHRQATADVDLCGVKVPKGTTLSISVAMLHRDEEVWGPDAGEFRPLRFRGGVSRAAAHPSALLAFSFGPRSCIGQDLAMVEAKATLALILRRFSSFEVAPEYVHAPTNMLTLQPLHGLPVVLKLVDP